MRKLGRKNVVYAGFMDLEKAYHRVNREALRKCSKDRIKQKGMSYDIPR